MFVPPGQGIPADAGTARIQLPPQRPAEPGDRWRAAAVAVLNLTGLGLGYVLMRRWLPAILCWIATGILLIIALPAAPGGVAGGLLVVYLVLLAAAAAHGAILGLRTPLTWPQRPQTALILAVVLLVVPIGGSLLFNQMQQNAIQQMLLGRLSQADQIIADTDGDAFATAEPDYGPAVATYRDLLDNYPDSKAGKLVPGRLASFYKTVALPYSAGQYCDAIAPLSYLRSLSGSFTAGSLGSLATSLYQCGVGALGTSGSTTPQTDLNQLLTTFPTSAQAAKVAPAVAAAISSAAAGISGSNPCSATTHLHTLGTQATGITSSQSDVTAALSKAAATATRDVESGTFACGVSQYKGGSFSDAQTTMDNFTSTYPHDSNVALAGKFSIAAQIAEQEPAAGKVIPTLASGGSVSVTILNDSPDPIEILYTGGDTGTLNLSACGSCSTYPSDADGQANACGNSSTNYPQVTIDLPAGTTYFLHQATNDSDTTPSAFSEQYSDGNAYEDCAYETSALSSLL